MNIGNITSDNFNLDGNGKDIQIEVYEQLIEQLQKENKILKENAEHNDKVVDKVNWENMLLKKKYENAVADYESVMFEKEQLNSLVNSCQEEIRRLKKQLEEERNKVREYSYKLSNFRCEETYENQQKDFIEYMNKTIEELECDDVDNEEMKGYLIQRIDSFKEILSKYKSIIGGKE